MGIRRWEGRSFKKLRNVEIENYKRQRSISTKNIVSLTSRRHLGFLYARVRWWFSEQDPFCYHIGMTKTCTTPRYLSYSQINKTIINFSTNRIKMNTIIDYRSYKHSVKLNHFPIMYNYLLSIYLVLGGWNRTVDGVILYLRVSNTPACNIVNRSKNLINYRFTLWKQEQQ